MEFFTLPQPRTICVKSPHLCPKNTAFCKCTKLLLGVEKEVFSCNPNSSLIFPRMAVLAHTNPSIVVSKSKLPFCIIGQLALTKHFLGQIKFHVNGNVLKKSTLQENIISSIILFALDPNINQLLLSPETRKRVSNSK